MSGKEEAKKVGNSPAVEAILNGTLNTSQKIRALAKEGLSRGTIAILLNKRYQHVRNVLITPIKNA